MDKKVRIVKIFNKGSKSVDTYHRVESRHLSIDRNGVLVRVEATNGSFNFTFYPWHRVMSIGWSSKDEKEGL